MKSKVLKAFALALLLIILLSLTGCGTKTESQKDIVENEVYHTYLVYNLIESDDKDLKDLNMVFAFDENDICTDSRMQWIFATEDIAKTQYDNWVKVGSPNLKIDGSTVSFNSTAEIGKTKNEIKNSKMGNFEIKEY